MIRSSRLDLAPAATNEARLRAVEGRHFSSKTLSRVRDEEDIGRNEREQSLSQSWVIDLYSR